MTEDNTVLVVAVLAVIASLAAAGFSYYSLSNGPSVVGFATSTGIANLTITSTANINFTTNSVQFGDGAVDALTSAAQLDTSGTTNQNATSDPWATPGPLVLENIGNTNVSLTLVSDKAAATFIGGTSPSFRLNVSSSEAGACSVANFSAYDEVTTSAQFACNVFGYLDSADQIHVNVRVRIPYDAPTGNKLATITAEGTGL